ncbi:carboxy terminal-processing peptidase [Halobacteriovorax sp. GB3]|uniref:carboxy terminal-processing peptidase n=1 Tax=Halobacteriovorax sp. GB3 TaxID=2719615 RepID=UPI00235F7274|nr:carboxy terminal-processing peptidase [Halobacteriovorax sp. GB3]MDD0851947.1 carboxy terminal-processing peptidase [Halobacteriovorax sp. GB3]
MKYFLITGMMLSLTYPSFAEQNKGPDLTPNPKKESFIGNMVKGALEQGHYRKLKVNDSVSVKAFEEYLKRIDYAKHFLTQADVKELRKYQYKMDDQMKSGDHVLLGKTIDLVTKRVKEAEKYREEYFKKGFDFSKDESLELDPEKREFVANAKEHKELWRKIFKQSVLTRYYTLAEDQIESQKEDKKDKKDKKKDKAKKKEKILTDAQLQEKAKELVNKKYKRYFERQLQENRTDYFEKFFNSIATIFDPHTVYLPPKRKEDFDIDISGQLEGIGAVLQEDDGYIKVVTIVPGGAAWRQKGLEVDDVILSVSEGEEGEPVDLVGMRVQDAVRYIRGKKDTEVRLTVRKADGARKVIPIIRDVVQVGESYAKSSVLKLKDSDYKVGYIHLPKFYRDFENNTVNCTNDVKNEVNRLKKQNVDAIILDLRNNGGGALIDATEMSGLFIKQGPIVQVKDSRGYTEIKKDTDPSVEYDGPMVVMVNRFSASASEILAGALQDYKRAVIVGGEYSHGKGTVQAIYNLNQGALVSFFGPVVGALKVTIQKFYRVNGDSTQYKGVTPDIILPDPYAYVENREQDLDYSLPWDKVQPLKYDTWKRFSYDLNTLSSNSQKRVSKDQWFSKLQKNIDYLTKRKNETNVTLNFDKFKSEEEKNKKIVEELKIEKEFKDLEVTNFEASLKAHEKINPGDEKHWKDDFKQRKDEWVSTLRKDIQLRETMSIVGDMLKGKSVKQYKLAADKSNK